MSLPLVQVTVWPALMVTLDGLKSSSGIATAAPGFAGGVATVFEVPEQAPVRSTAPIAATAAAGVGRRMWCLPGSGVAVASSFARPGAAVQSRIGSAPHAHDNCTPTSSEGGLMNTARLLQLLEP